MRNKTLQRPDPDARYWRLPAVKTYTGRSRSSIYADPTFPKSIRIATNTSVWLRTAVIAWCESRESMASSGGDA